jgi:hypothetical protein
MSIRDVASRHSNGIHMHKLFSLILILITSGTLYAAESERFITKLKLPTGETVMVAEGELEARSIGSFSIRLYDAAAPGDETTFFRSGLIRPRDGVIEKVVLADVAGDRRPEIVVMVRSAGTGSYLSAQAFSVDRQRLLFRVAVDSLRSDADPLAALRKAGRKRR